MTELPADLPPDVTEYYRRMAERGQWRADVEAAFLRSVARYRRLDDGPGPRGYYERIDEEGLYDQGGRWLWETVSVDTVIIAVKQIEVTSAGVVHRYDWRRLEDMDGGLTDQPLYPEEEELRPITRETFYHVWDVP